MDIRSTEFAHDLKMPIQLIYSCVQLLEMELQSGSRAEGYLKMLVQSADQLQTMVTNVLDDSRCPGTDIGLRLAMVDVAGVVRDICRRTELFANEKRVRIGFWTNASEFIMKTDGEKLGRILNNLLSNAIRFTPESGSIAVQLQIMGDAVEISVRDTGCGVAEPERIFDRGYTKGGHGYGLAIVREYAGLLGGSISVKPNESSGSCFTLRLPVRN